MADRPLQTAGLGPALDQLYASFNYADSATDPIQIVRDGIEAIAYMMGEGKYSDRQKYAYPTFIITDLKMPRADGFAVLEFLKGNPQWKVIPTIVLSASADLDDIKTAKNYVQKALDEALAGKPVSTPTSAAYGCSIKY